MNNKVLIGIVVLIILLGGGYFAAKAVKHAFAPAPVPMQQVTQTTPTPMTGGSSPTAMQAQNVVTLTQNGWSPATLTVKAGETVTWVNKSGEAATVNSDPHPTHTDYPPLNLGSFSDGQSLSLAFPKAGTYGYHNHLNPSEKGTITVQ